MASGGFEGFWRELESGVFKEVVEEEEEFSHDGGEGDLGGFVGGAEVEIEGAQDMIEAGGA